MLEYLYGKRFGSKIDWADRLRLFLSQTFSRINTPTFSYLLTLHTYPPMKMEKTECSETSAYKIQTPENNPEESTQHSEQGESLKSRTFQMILYLKNKRPTWCHLLFYFTSYVLNMFRTLIYLSSGAFNYSVELPHWSYCSWFDVCWSFGVVGLEWYQRCKLQPATRIPLQLNHTETPTHIEPRTIRPMW